MATTKNPQSKPINQKRGPTTGNGDNGAKRQTFIDEKKDSGNERSRLADFVMDALGMRGKGMAPHVDPALENINSSSSKSTGISRNPTAGGTKYNVRSKTAGKITK
jgi:hypothetical protein